MKKIISGFVFFYFLAITAFSQPFGNAARGFQLDKIRYENASGEKATTYFHYDQEQTLYKAYWTLDTKHRWSLNYYEYDHLGNLCSAFREFSDSLFSHEHFNYDKRGNLTEESFERSDGVSGYARHMYRNNKLISSDLVDHKGWLNGTITYTYQKNKKIKAELKKGGRLSCTITYTYDAENNLIKEHWDFNGNWYQTFYYDYKRVHMKKTYYTSPYIINTSIYRIKSEDYTFNGKIGGPSHYRYNNKNELIEKVFERSDGISTTTYYTYKKNGQLETSFRNYSDGSKGYFTYEYDEHGHLINREFFKNDSSIALESHLYDHEGKLIKTFLRNFDAWLNGHIVYHHNAVGRIIKGIFTGNDGFNAEIFFFYDDRGLLFKYVWEFSTGDYQRYNFEYEDIK